MRARSAIFLARTRRNPYVTRAAGRHRAPARIFARHQHQPEAAADQARTPPLAAPLVAHEPAPHARGARLFRAFERQVPLTQFSGLGLAEPILRAVTQEGYTTPTPIQRDAIPYLLAGRDLLGIAQTGTGKTAAFALPLLQRLATGGAPAPRTCRVLVLAPTRELAGQIADSFRAYGRHLRLSVTVVVGGVKHGPQQRALARGVDVLVATPGRLIDHIEASNVMLDRIEAVVLDEADQMLDLGFLPPIRRILSRLPRDRQSLFFSATMPQQIEKLSGEMLRDPARVTVTPVASTAERVNQHLYLVEQSRKPALLLDVLNRPEVERVLVFTRTKRGADRVTLHLETFGVPAAAIHGNKSQTQRERALGAFRSGRNRVLVATDIAARGIDVDGVTHVVNYELPDVPEAYVHRIGRTARAGADGTAISFCDGAERGQLRDIEKLIRKPIPQTDHRLARGETAGAEMAGEAAAERRPARGHAPAHHRNGGERRPHTHADARPHTHTDARPHGENRGGENRGAPGGQRRRRRPQAQRASA
jgi:ATP-dependent RNA helicase RhlE